MQLELTEDEVGVVIQQLHVRAEQTMRDPDVPDEVPLELDKLEQKIRKQRTMWTRVYDPRVDYLEVLQDIGVPITRTDTGFRLG